MSNVKTAFRMILVLTVVTGIAYPLFVTALAQLLFNQQANGSLVKRDGKSIGSALIGQKFTDDRYFWLRPSAVDYNPMPSSGTNLGPTSSVLRDSVTARIARLRQSTDSVSTIPPDLLFTSGSGLDPHVSPEAAFLQMDRVGRARGLDSVGRNRLDSLIKAKIETPVMGLFGEPRVNILLLNLAVDSDEALR